MPAPAPPPAATPASAAAAALLAALPPAFRLPAPAPAPASVRALATATVGAAPLIGLRAGAAAAANPARGPLRTGAVTTEAARAAAVSLFGADVFAAEERAAAAAGGDEDDDEEEDEDGGGGGAKKARARDKPSPRRRLPPGFDWRAYLEYNPDVRAFGVDTPATAAGHYLAYGAREGRLSRRVPVALRYTACGGLANQHYSHVSALSLAVALGADALLPQAARRDTFAHYFSEDRGRNRVVWRGAPLASLWEPSSAGELLRAAGGDAALSPPGAGPPDLTLPAEAFQTYGLGTEASSASAAAATGGGGGGGALPPIPFGPAQVVRLGGVYQGALPLRELVDEAREAVVRAAMAAVSGAREAAAARGERGAALLDPRYDVPPPVVLDLPCALFSAEAAGSPLAAAVARQLRFSREISSLADRVVAAMAAGLGGSADEASAASSALAAAREEARAGAAGGRDRGGGGSGGGSGGASGGDKNSGGTAPRTAAQRLARDARFWRSGAGGFNGLHLRVEADARDWLRAMGGREAFWGAYLDLLREAGFGTDGQARRAMVGPPASPAAAAAAASASAALAAEAAAASRLGGGAGARNATTGGAPLPDGAAPHPADPDLLASRPGLPLYVATGLPSYAKPGGKAAAALDELRARLRPHGARLVFKEDVLPAAELAALQPDQLALVDFLVLARARGFAGLSASTFSVLVREHRALHSIAPRETAWLVDCSAVGSEPLFARAAVFDAAGGGVALLGSHAAGKGIAGGGGGGRDLL